MKHFFTLLAAFACLTLSQAQPGSKDYLKFDKLEHDFGTINEADGSVKVRFSFINNSDQPVWIVRVETTCGCTTPDWSKDTIPPGGSGFVDATYDAKNRIGTFSKNIMVYPNIPNYYRFLKISGNVVGRPQPDYNKGVFPVSYGNLAFSKTTLNFDPIYNNQKLSETIKVVNLYEYPVQILEILEKPDYITLDIPEKTIKANDSITMTVHVDGSKINDYMSVYGRILVKTDDMLYPEKFIFLMLNAKEYFPKMSAKQLAQMPSVSVSDDNKFNLGSIREGAVLQRTLTITNKGKSDLVIRKIAPNCSCMQLSLSSTTIKPGESATLSMKYDSIMQSPGVHRKWIKMVTNDPAHPEVSISVNVEIQ